jgi:hypothetical protein
MHYVIKHRNTDGYVINNVLRLYGAIRQERREHSRYC